MARPPVYEKIGAYEDHSTATPNTPHLGTNLDADFLALKATTDALIANQSKIQSANGSIKSGAVDPDSLSTETRALIVSADGWTPKGGWAATTSYLVGDVVTYLGRGYVCHTTHTSGSSFDTSKFTALSNAGYEINVRDYGAVGDGVADDTTAIQNAINDLELGAVLVIPYGTYLISSMLTTSTGFAAVKGKGKLQAKTGYTDPYMLDMTREDESDFFHWPTDIESLYLDCNWLTRGIRAYNFDHIDWQRVRIEKPYGHGLFLDRFRESNIFAPILINGKARTAFSLSGVNAWDSGTSYTVGTIVARNPDDYDAGTTYGQEDCVLSGGLAYMSLEDSNTGNAPASNLDKWAQVPLEYYECMVNNSNKDPWEYNTNNATQANRLWQKKYRDEALLEINDDQDPVIPSAANADRTNQLNIFGPVLRDSGNKCYLRIDNNRQSGYATHVNIWGGHIHNVGDEVIQSPDITVTDLSRMIEIGRCQNINIYGSNIRIWDSDHGIGVMIGDMSTLKTAQNTQIWNCPISGDGDYQRGVLVMPSATSGGGDSILRSKITLTGSDCTDIFDPDRYFRMELINELQITMHEGLGSAPKMVETVFPSTYSDVRMFQATISGDAQPVMRMQYSSSIPRLQMGPGGSTSPDVELKRGASNRWDFGENDIVKLGGAWNTGHLRLGDYHIWVDSTGDLRIKDGAPANDTDGAVVGTQS